MTTYSLGKKEKVDIRNVFKTEDGDFTPWLKEHIGSLSEELGITLVEVTKEDPVGRYSCDITAKEEGTERMAVIENQYGHTDHRHLGQVMTYASGKDANVVIWIAESFGAEHKKALQWLNDNADAQKDLSFYGVEVRLEKIDGSLPAVSFDVVVEPNESGRSLKRVAQSSPSGKAYFAFFTILGELYGTLETNWHGADPRPHNWMVMGPAAFNGVIYDWAFKDGVRFAVQLVIRTGDSPKNKAIFDALIKSKNDIEAEVTGLKWTWDRGDNSKESKVILTLREKAYAEQMDPGQMKDLAKLGAETMVKFRKAVDKRLKTISLA